MTKYLVSFFNTENVWLETVTVGTKSTDKNYIKALAKKQSKYQIDRDCDIKVYADGEEI